MRLNDAQQQCVENTSGAILVLAGAGSGKTRIITQKIQHLIENKGLNASNIAALTFTNKSAREMRERVSKSLHADKRKGLMVSTFHRLGLDIVRSEQTLLDRRNGFSILDAADQQATLADLLGAGANIDQTKMASWHISQWKNNLLAPNQVKPADNLEAKFVGLYEKYQHRLQAFNAVDFDDLIALPAQLFQQNPEARDRWRHRLRYLLVDEYQDTNIAQYELFKLIAGPTGDFTVVGDDDQSIYAWRGACPENLHKLSEDYPRLKIIKLEQNYRCTNQILGLANTLIANNSHLFEKKLWSDNGMGECANILPCRDSEAESERVVTQLLYDKLKRGWKWQDYAILYRSNFQARQFEKLLRLNDVPYKISGGRSFFENAEVKDIMAYLKLCANPDDDMAFLRVVNVPRRELGTTTINALNDYAQRRQSSLFGAATEFGLQSCIKPRAWQRLEEFTRLIVETSDDGERGDVMEAIKNLLNSIDYRLWLEDNSPDPKVAERRWQNINELLDWISRLVDKDMTLGDIASHLSLMDMLERNEDETLDRVQLMTLHAAKGLEFRHVFLTGLEEGLLPHQNSIEAETIEEERRLAYVGITRAKEVLTMSYSQKRRRAGETVDTEPSRFLGELPADELLWDGAKKDETLADKKARGQGHLAALKALVS